MNLTLPASRASVADARHAVVNYARPAGVELDNVATAVSEAVANSVLHGYRDGAPGHIRLRAERDDANVTVTVADDGVGLMPTLQRAGVGAGLALIGAMTDEVTYASSGTGLQVTMRFSRSD